jgi:C4-dicarboxylate-specific signal transduction histidine kinase
VTAYNDRSVDSIQALLGENANSSWDYLSKPFSSGEILQKARNFTSLWNLRAEKKAREEVVSSLQHKLMESERMSAVAAVARGVNHEFGNILMQVVGKADLARGKSPEMMNDALNKILDATNRASDILDRFRHLANGSHMESEKEMTELPQLVEEALTLLEHQIKMHGLKVCKIKMEKVMAPVQATSILQVLVNVIINAMHAMGTSGQIDISVRKADDQAEIYIRDYGPGIPENLLEKAKEPFFTTKGDQGTGLGLAISNEIVEMEHQGTFLIKNHGVKGLEVRLLLPLEEEKLDAPA